MRRFLPYFIVALLAGTAGFASAQEPTQTPAPFPRVRSTELRQTAQRIHVRMMEVNRARLSGYEHIIERLRNMLERITAVADRYEARGADATAVYDAVAEARRALDAAQAAVRQQSSREYLLDGATDATVREQLQGMREQLADDLHKVGGLLRTALEKVREAVRSLRSIRTS